MPEADGIVGLAPGAARMMIAMTIQAVVFDIGGVLEINRDLGVTGMWESRLGLGPGELNERMADVWRGGSIGMISEDDVRQAVRECLGLDGGPLAEFMSDIWREYLGTANTELIGYVRQLRPRCRTGILSNSFVGARRTRAGRLRVRRPRRRDHLLPRVRHEQARPRDLRPHL